MEAEASQRGSHLSYLGSSRVLGGDPSRLSRHPLPLSFPNRSAQYTREGRHSLLANYSGLGAPFPALTPTFLLSSVQKLLLFTLSCVPRPGMRVTT